MNLNISVKDLLDAGVHFGHQTKRWNPRSKPYIFDHRQGISIIDLGKTHANLEKACSFVEELIANGNDLLFVGTKRQAQEIVREAATSVGMPFCANRWLGGTLTNYETIKRSIAKYKKYQAMEASGELAKLPKKEESAIKREMARMLRNFEGITGMDGLPSAMFVIDTNHEEIAVAEGNRVNIPIIGLVDSNSDPSVLTYPIPGNDDAVKSIRIIVEAIVEAIQQGLSQREMRNVSKGAPADVRTAPVQQAEIEAAPAPAPVSAPAPAPVPVSVAAGVDLEEVELPPAIGDLDEEVEEKTAEEPSSEETAAPPPAPKKAESEGEDEDQGVGKTEE